MMEMHDLANTFEPTLPPKHVLQAALRKTTEVFAREIAAPSNQVPRWTDLEWRIAEAAAVMQGISALLANRLRWRGPQRWETFLAGQQHHTRKRQERITQLTGAIDAAARSRGIALVALKGAALHQLDLYPLQDRPMSDIDLLAVDDWSFQAATQMMPGLGYRRGQLKERHQAFDPVEGTQVHGFGEHERNPIRIELHPRVLEELPLRRVDITPAIHPKIGHAGLNRYPSIAALMRHLLLHAAGNMRARALRFIQLHDVARLARRMNCSDWQELLAEPSSEGKPWWAFAPLVLTERYFPHTIPAHVIDAVEADCTRLLRRTARLQSLTDVSWSRLDIQAFPGIEWAHSVPEALRFMSSRIFPSRNALTDMWNTVATRPYTNATPWYGLPHAQRIVQWLFASPPRVQTIYSIRIALGLQRP